jgi:hypothetical protein
MRFFLQCPILTQQSSLKRDQVAQMLEKPSASYFLPVTALPFSVEAQLEKLKPTLSWFALSYCL